MPVKYCWRFAVLCWPWLKSLALRMNHPRPWSLARNCLSFKALTIVGS